MMPHMTLTLFLASMALCLSSSHSQYSTRTEKDRLLRANPTPADSYSSNDAGPSPKSPKSDESDSNDDPMADGDGGDTCEAQLEAALAPSLLYVQMGTSCKLSKSQTGQYMLMLQNVDDEVFAFTDRPFRHEKIIPTTDFVNGFNDTFETSFPNAAATFIHKADSEGSEKFEGPLVSVLLNSAYADDDGSVSYEIFQSEEQKNSMALDQFFAGGDGSVSDTFEYCSLYIDSGGGYTCGKRCSRNSDCQTGGFITCPNCNLVAGTLGYKTCYNPNPEPEPEPEYNPFPVGGVCKQSCKTNSDCQPGGFNPCGQCGQYAGTLTYHLCYAPQ